MTKVKLKPQTWVGRIGEKMFRKYGKPDYLSAQRTRDIIAAQTEKNEQPLLLPPKYRKRFSKEILGGVETYRLPGTRRVILYLHGGSFIKQPNFFHLAFLARLHRHTHCTMLLSLYPKAPVHTYKEANASVLAVYRELIRDVSPDNIVVMGDSAGGTLALALALMLKDAGLPQPHSYILLSPAPDLTQRPELAEYDAIDPLLALPGVREVIAAWVGYDESLDLHDPMVSPYYGELSGLPPVSTFAGTHDMMLLDSRRLHEKLKKSGVNSRLFEGEKLNHVFPMYPIPEGLRAARLVAEIVME